jgi:hypothetical protein
MRLASWAGIPVVGFAFASGFAANEMVHRHSSVAAHYVAVAAGEELSERPPLPPMPLPAEEIDLSCHAVAFGQQSTEPPLAGGVPACGSPAGLVRAASYELPASAPEGPELPPVPETMPYLTDDAAPGTLPRLGDVPTVAPMPDPGHPLFKAVKKFLDTNAAPAAPDAGDVTDKVPLGQPPVSEHPSAVTPGKP